MNISISSDKVELTVTAASRLDTVSSGELKLSLDGNLSGMEKLIFDFRDVEYVSSAGLRVILAAHKEMASRGGMKIINMNKDVFKIFECVGFTDFMKIETV